MQEKVTSFSGNILNLLILVFISTLCFSCKPSNANKEGEKELTKGTFAYDMDFLGKYHNDLIVLKEDNAQLIISPALQGRVLTSMANGLNGQSFGWLNYDLIASGELMEHINPYGGEERFWLGPEGGQFSIYFKQDTTFEFANWYVPKELDTASFDLVHNDEQKVAFEKRMKLVNYSGTFFDCRVDRNVRLIGTDEAARELGMHLPEGIQMVGFESINVLTNTGENTWKKDSGMLSIWILSMLNSTDETTVIIPFKTGDESELGKLVTDDYFGKVAEDRLSVVDSVLLFKGDGKQRGKIGISPQRALPFMGSFDAINKVLTVAKFTLPKGKTDYVNSEWVFQEKPYAGDAVNAYNDGPLEDGTQLGPFYELESSSPAAALKPNESMVHKHQTYHFEGDKKSLDQITMQLFGITLDNLK